MRALAFLFALLFSLPVAAQDKLTVLLDWFVNPDHGPLVIAQQRGIFARRGLTVELIAPADPNDPPKLVAAGRADIAIGYQPQLHIQVDQGLPLVRFGALVATPLNSLVVLRDGPVKSLADLKGKKVGYSVGGFEDALLKAMLAPHGLGLKDVELVNINFALSPALLSGRVDAVIGAFRNFELNQLDISNKPGRAWYPEENGVPAYDELILLARPDRVQHPAYRRFIDALEDATTYIHNNPQAAWDQFKTYRKELDDELNKRAWRDTLPRFAHAPAALDKARYVRFAAFLKGQGLIKEALPVERYAVEIK